MMRLVTYDDWQMNFDPQTGRYFATDEDGVHECELVGFVKDSSKYDEHKLLNGIDIINRSFDFGGELDEPLVKDLGIIDGVHKFDYIYQYGYWKIID